MNKEQKVAMTQEEQKEVMLNILTKFADFCEAYGLQYFLDAETLLGAVRHKGYIPWDDDIDVNMPRPDWEQFCAIAKKKNGFIGNHLYVEFPEDTIFPFLKVADDRTVLVEYPDKNPMEVGVYMDIFPKDGIVDLSRKSKVICNVSYILRLWHWFNVFSIYAWKNSDSRLCRFIAACGRKFIKHPNMPLRLQQKWIASHNKKHPIDECEYVTTLVNGEFHKCAPRKCFAEYIMLKFENREFRAPIGYDTYLRCLYPGDYMQIPPVEKREKHNTEVYWKTREAKEEFCS